MTKAFTIPLDKVVELLGVGRRQLLEWLWQHPCDMEQGT